MKLTAVILAGTFTLASASVLADHRHYDSEWHHHKKAEHHYQKASKHYRLARRHERQASREIRAHLTREQYGRVIDVEPVYRYYREPVTTRSCLSHDTGRATYTSYTGTVLGAVIGSALGHRIGDAHGDPTAAAVAGGLLGASVGRDMDRRAAYNRGLQVDGPCRVRQVEQTRRQLVEYKVSYRYNGEVHHARMDYDPGEWVKLDVEATPA